MMSIGPWLFDRSSRRLVTGDEERRLSPKAAAVLMALAETPRQVWSRDALLERVWPGVHVGEEVLTHAIAELRRSFGEDFRAPRYLETVHKAGYRLICPVEILVWPDGDGRGHGPAASAGAQLRDDPEFDFAAYAAFLEACELFDRGGRHSTERSVALFQDVLDRNPGFSPAHVGLAKALAFLGTYYVPGQPRLDEALAHCQAALRITPRSAPALAAEGLICAIGGNFDRALRQFRASVLLDPGSSETHYLLGRACFAELNISLAAPMLERAAALRSDDYHALMLAGKARQMLGQEELAKANFQRALTRIEQRTTAYPDDYRALCFRARALVHLGRLAEAEAIMDRLGGHPDPIAYHLACTFARAGETRLALDTLEEVVELGWKHSAWLARDPDFDGLRHHPRFARMASAMERVSH